MVDETVVDFYDSWHPVGFDTHARQRNRHDRLLEQLAEAMGAFRTAMQQICRWEQVMVMTYSEFGRRPAENGSRGTDDGTAAPENLTRCVLFMSSIGWPVERVVQFSPLKIEQRPCYKL